MAHSARFQRDISLTWERHGVPPDELQKVAGMREVWASLLRLLPSRSRRSSRNGMDGSLYVLYLFFFLKGELENHLAFLLVFNY